MISADLVSFYGVDPTQQQTLTDSSVSSLISLLKGYGFVGGSNYLQDGPKLVGSDAIGPAQQGKSVSLSADGTTLAVAGDFDNTGVGAIWVFVKNDGFWSQQGSKIVPGDVIGTASISTVSLSADGNTMVFGGYHDNGAIGATWVYVRSQNAWSQQAKLIATGAIGSANQGGCVSVSADGNTLVTGAIADNDFVGAAWVFTRSGTVWTQQAKLVGSGSVGQSYQGLGVSITLDGLSVAIGAPYDNNYIGAVWVFVNDGGWTEQARLVASDSVGTDVEQGYSLCIRNNTLAVGAAADNNGVGAVWIYTRSNGVWSQQTKLIGTGSIGFAAQGHGVSLNADADILVFGGTGDNNLVGALWVFKYAGGVWTQFQKIVPGGYTDTPLISLNQTDACISADGSTIATGGEFDSESIGATWVFTA